MSTAKAAWPYDADRDDPLTALRIPVTGTHPGFTYTACFDRDSAVRPTDAEARMIASFIQQYQEYWFGDGRWRKVQQAKPFDMDCYTTSIFHKWADNDWSYRCCTWVRGPFWVPLHPGLRATDHNLAKVGPLTLEQVMDRIHHFGTKYPDRHWAEWKTAHPDVFPSPAQTPAPAPAGEEVAQHG